MTARLLSVTHDEYRRDPSPIPTLTQSIAKILVTRSPAHAWLRHPRLGNQPQEPSDVLDRGALIDHLLLGQGAQFVILDYDEYRTKEARAARDDARASGKIPVKRIVYEEAEKAIIAIKANMAAQGIKLDEHGVGGKKFAIEWTEGDVLCRCEMDHVEISGLAALISDVKTCDNASPARLDRVIDNFLYQVQHAAYVRALAALMPELSGRIKMRFIFVEPEPPYSVVEAYLNGAFRADGEAQWLRAVQIWQRCLSRDEWPSYSSGPVTIDLPPWRVKELVDG